MVIKKNNEKYAAGLINNYSSQILTFHCFLNVYQKCTACVRKRYPQVVKETPKLTSALRDEFD
jgi:hypothetical protein